MDIVKNEEVLQRLRRSNLSQTFCANANLDQLVTGFTKITLLHDMCYIDIILGNIEEGNRG